MTDKIREVMARSEPNSSKHDWQLQGSAGVWESYYKCSKCEKPARQDSDGKELAIDGCQPQALPQGVEEWINKHCCGAWFFDKDVLCVSADDLRAYLSGMAIVPVEPTDEMVDYAERMDWSIPDSRAVVINIWQAMLAAAKEKGE